MGLKRYGHKPRTKASIALNVSMVAVILGAACLTVFLVIVYFIHKHISYDLIVSDLERVEDYIGDSLRLGNMAPRTQGKATKRASFVRHGQCEGVSLPITKDASPGSCQLGHKYGGQAYIQSPPPATANMPHTLSVFNTTDFIRRWRIAQQLVGVNTTVFGECAKHHEHNHHHHHHHHHHGRRRELQHIHHGNPHVHQNQLHQHNQQHVPVGQAEHNDGAHWHGHGNVHGNLNSQHAGHGNHNHQQHHSATHHPHTRAHHHPLTHVAHVDCGKPVTSLIRLWLYTSHGVCVPTNYNVIYFRNYKVANDMIRFSLDPKAKAHGCEFNYGSSALYDPSYCSFSFVRHPFDRFVSGYSEAERRWLMLRMRSMEQRKTIEERRKAEKKAKREDGAAVPSETHGEGTKTVGDGAGQSDEDQKTSAQKDEEERMLNERELYDKLTEAEKRKREEEEELSDEDEDEQDQAHAHRIENLKKKKNSLNRHPVLPYSPFPNVPGRLDPTLEAAPGEEIGTTNRALAFVRSILHLEWLSSRPVHSGRPRSMPTSGEIERWWRHEDAILHVFPQVGAFANHGVDFMGHFESFNNDWDAMQRYCNFTFDGKMEHNMERQRLKAQHPTGSSHDELGTYKAMRTLIETDAHVARALCHILYYDFVYFGYSFPPACSDMAPP